MEAIQKDQFGASDLEVVVVTGRGDIKAGDPVSCRSYSSTLFLLHRKVVCDGPRPSLVFKTLFGSSELTGKQNNRLEIDMVEEEANVFPQLVGYIYSGTPLSEDDIALMNLARRFQAFPESSIQSETLVAGSTMSSSQSDLNCHSEEHKSPKAQSPAKKAVQHKELVSALDLKRAFQGLLGEKEPNKCAKKSCLASEPPENQSSAVHTLESFQAIPDLMREMRSECDVKRCQAKESLENLLTIPEGQEQHVASLVMTSGSIPFLLEILSGDQYATLHLDSVELLNVVAKDSEFYASRLEKALVVEKMLDCQLIHGLEIRARALRVMTSIAMHSENLCGQVLNKGDCVNYVRMAYERKETKNDAFLLLCQFCDFFPQHMLKEDAVVRAISGEIQPYFEAATPRFVKLVNVASSNHHESLLSGGVLHLGYVIAAADRGTHAPRGKQALRVLTGLVHRFFILRHLLSWGTVKQYISKLMWSPCKQAQALTCALVAALAKAMRENDTGKKYEEWSKTELLPPLVKLLAYEGVARVPATMATTELIRYSTPIAKAFVAANGIPPLCDVLNCTITDGGDQEGLKTNILLALQRLSEIENWAMVAPDAGDVMHSIGTNLSRAVLGGRYHLASL